MTKKPQRMSAAKKTALIGTPLAVLALGYLGTAFLTGHSTPNGTTVAGVDVGGRDRGQIVEALDAGLDERADEELSFRAAGEAVDSEEKHTTAAASAAEAGVSLDVDATADSLVGFTLDPRIIIDRIVGGSERAPVLGIDDAKLEAVSQTVAENLSVDAENAGLAYGKDTADVTEARTGTSIDSAAVVDAVRSSWLRSETIDVEAEAAQPDVSTEEAQRVKEEVADPAISDDVTLTVTGQVDDGENLTVTPDAIRSAAQFRPDGDSLEMTFDGKRLVEVVMDDNSSVGKKATDASFTIRGGKPEVVPSENGVSVSEDALVAAVQTALEDDSRSAEVELSAQQADFTTEDAQKADVSDVISEFSTPFQSQVGRDTNLKVASKKVSGTVLQPGEQFSLNDTLGPRTAAAGYKQAGVISGGQMKEDFGGGVSQVSTTLFNAAFFAGFDLDEHTAHSRYISRYPEGRETTLDYTSIDLKFTNNSTTPVVLDMYVSDGKVHARIFGQKTVDVEAGASERFNFTSPSTVTESGSECKPQSPKEGWSITIHRTIKDADSGATVKEDEFTTVYRPVNKVTCQ